MEEQCVPVEVITTRRRGRSSSYFKGLLFGGLVGAGIALLAAPRSGEATRVMLREKGVELKEKAKTTADDARLRAEEMARTGADRLTELKERSQSFLDTQKVTLLSAVEGVREGVKTYRENPPDYMEATSLDAEEPAPLAPAPNSDLAEPRS